mgnify:CR=1 FL=1
MNAPLLEIEGLEAAYGASQVLFGIGFAMKQGEVATLLGRNGMGKTTTVRAITGVLQPRGGSIRIRTACSRSSSRSKACWCRRSY